MLIKWNRCGKVLFVEKDTGVETLCCGEPMTEVVSNSVDAAVEKHVPTYEVRGDKVVVRVNHVMEDDHYIEWISMETDTRFEKAKLKPGMEPVAVFDYIPGSVLYSYCNKHSLWKADVE